MNIYQQFNQRRQQGAVLVVSLMLLLILTLIGLTGMQTTNLEESMAGSARNYNIALQAAEAALLAGEAAAAVSTSADYGSRDGYHEFDGQNPIDVYDLDTWTDDEISIAYSGVFTAVSADPRYMIEELGEFAEAGATSGKSIVSGTSYQSTPTLNAYRITARATGGNESAAVILQTTYSVQN